MPCKHEFAEIVRNGIQAPATLIYCESWRYSEGFKKFELQALGFIQEEKKTKKKWIESKHFIAKYVSEDELIEQFLRFLKEKLFISEWLPFVEAFVRLFFGGKSCSIPPIWRIRQLMKKGEKK